ncbi:hypothetical protein BOX15_Mlig025908g1 [Macrostomum lignano]|uniref:BTB domain-containing protein n=2 Tax=Macrostomum lignano TaxID=282301 RepID=A0A1I8IZK0_9PLAT|nr:hypothetical protein BOX15_Mlig025908g1 [Macrostomum lignano]
MRTDPASPPSEDDRIRFGLSTRMNKQELLDLLQAASEGAVKSKPLSRVDGLEFTSIGCGILVLAESDSLHVVFCLRALDICCEYEIRARLTCCIQIDGNLVSCRALAEPASWTTGREIVTLPSCLSRSDLENPAGAAEETSSDPSASIVEFCFLLRITDASPAFLKPPPVAAFDGVPGNGYGGDDEEDEEGGPSEEDIDESAWVTLRCRDGSVRAPRLLLLTHSDYCRVLLTSPLWNFDADRDAAIHCDAEYTFEMKCFLFYLQSHQSFNIARFETFRMLARIADQYGVPAVLLQCSRFINHCLQMDAAAKPTGSGGSVTSSSGEASQTQTRISWSPGDLVSLWLTCNRHLHEPQLQLAVMRAIRRHFSYSSVVQSQDFQFLSENDKNCFCHEFCLLDGGGSPRSQTA